MTDNGLMAKQIAHLYQPQRVARPRSLGRQERKALAGLARVANLTLPFHKLVQSQIALPSPLNECMTAFVAVAEEFTEQRNRNSVGDCSAA